MKGSGGSISARKEYHPSAAVHGERNRSCTHICLSKTTVKVIELSKGTRYCVERKQVENMETEHGATADE